MTNRQKYQLALIVDKKKFQRHVDLKLGDEMMKKYINDMDYFDVINVRYNEDKGGIDYFIETYIDEERVNEDYNNSFIKNLYDIFDKFHEDGIFLDGIKKL
jgi:hypothetical protein